MVASRAVRPAVELWMSYARSMWMSRLDTTPAAGATGRKRAAPAAAAAEESDAPAEREAKRGKAAAARAPSPQGRAEAKAKASGGNEPPANKTKAAQPPLPEPSSEERAL